MTRISTASVLDLENQKTQQYNHAELSSFAQDNAGLLYGASVTSNYRVYEVLARELQFTLLPFSRRRLS
ncbi:hypothetical protein RvY_01090 [Ramazzottius varieornatus]|uniref:Uncharacterized protein n=1 Tax=Ramazzottius varieornatus TaxID=947166 RepID=A0A1D1UG00_RAMVA|nr:hypothetical protein RvY_01090 [Ramazzottius varieornatus]